MVTRRKRIRWHRRYGAGSPDGAATWFAPLARWAGCLGLAALLATTAAGGHWALSGAYAPGSGMPMISAWMPAAAPAMPPVVQPRAMPVCGFSRRNCVVDGDTLWLDGEKIRLRDLDAPEINGHCRFERERAQRAKVRLAALLDGKRLSVERSGTDRYGRTLAVVRSGGRDVAAVLIEENLARRWTALRKPWC